VVPEVQQAVEQGRQLQELMREAGQRYLAALKRERSLGREFRRKAREGMIIFLSRTFCRFAQNKIRSATDRNSQKPFHAVFNPDFCAEK
jgi:hypothetical protein